MKGECADEEKGEQLWVKKKGECGPEGYSNGAKSSPDETQ